MSYPLCYHGNKKRKIKTMNPAFKHHVEQLPADIRHLFLHKLRVCPVEEAWNVLFYARLTDTLADAVANSAERQCGTSSRSTQEDQP